MSQATGWAVMAQGGRLFVRSVSETRRAAIINWLVTENKGVHVTTFHTDDDIEQMWRHFGQYVVCKPVMIMDCPTTNPPLSPQGSTDA